MSSPAPLRILSTLAVQAVLAGLLPKAPFAVTVEFDPTARLMARIAAGERGDIAILTEEAVAQLLSSGVLAPGSARAMARSHIGMAVQAGAPHPDISTVAALRATLLAAPSLAYSAAGASGIFFAGLIERLGIATEVNARATVIPQGFTAALAARGEVALAIQQVSELLAIPGIEIVGRLPEGANTQAVFSAGIFANAGRGAPPAAAQALAWLTAAMDAPSLRQAGLEPA